MLTSLAPDMYVETYMSNCDSKDYHLHIGTKRPDYRLMYRDLHLSTDKSLLIEYILIHGKTFRLRRGREWTEYAQRCLFDVSQYKEVLSPPEPIRRFSYALREMFAEDVRALSHISEYLYD